MEWRVYKGKFQTMDGPQLHGLGEAPRHSWASWPDCTLCLLHTPFFPKASGRWVTHLIRGIHLIDMHIDTARLKTPTRVWDTAPVNDWKSVQQTSILCGYISFGSGGWHDNDNCSQTPIKFILGGFVLCNLIHWLLIIRAMHVHFRIVGKQIIYKYKNTYITAQSL